LKLIVKKSSLKGRIRIPSSKSQTIRALIIGSLASGESQIKNPLESSDTFSCVKMCRAFGAKIEMGTHWIVKGGGRDLKVPQNIIDIRNSGTSCRLGLGMASLCEGYSVFTGDEQTRKRPMQSLINALNNLGARVFSTGEGGQLPVVVRGRMKGGVTEVDGVTSQFLSSLLISSPLADRDSKICVSNLRERPYVEMTLSWLDRRGIEYKNRDFEEFEIKGGQSYKPFQEEMSGDFSSATFFFCAGSLSDSHIQLEGLNMSDPQGDKKVIDVLRDLGASIDIAPQLIEVRGGSPLQGGEFDLSNIPDALPSLAVTACIAEGKTVLKNVSQARIKETDRIAVMKKELEKMGAQIEEMPDGLIIKKSPLKGTKVHGHSDHRVVMGLAIAGLVAEGVTEISTAEAIKITFPNFITLMKNLGADMSLIDD